MFYALTTATVPRDKQPTRFSPSRGFDVEIFLEKYLVPLKAILRLSTFLRVALHPCVSFQRRSRQIKYISI